MNHPLPFKRIVAAGLGAALMATATGALADPPSRIARLAYISGPVSFAPAGENTWEYASINRPLIPGDRLWVEAGARDELQVAGAALRMDGNTLVTLLNLGDRITQLQLSQGRLNVHVRRLRPNEVFEIDTPNLALTIRTPGDYRIEVDPAGMATMVAVQRGQAEAYGDGNAYRIGSGQAYSFGGTDLRDVRYARPALNDDFDRWSASRDRRVEQARSARYVSPDLIGYEDLDEQGTWRTVPNYGNVWTPAHVGRDWAPYRDGHWSYVQPWGWTWVDDAPWGFAVSHYGRWARLPDGWGWVPGPRAASPVYAPALVAFVSFSAGAYSQRERPVAWFPLAPREVYRPSYRASPNYITNINISNTSLNRSQIGRDDRRANYANRHVGGAVTAVPATAFTRAQPVSRSAVALPMAALAGAAIAHAAPVAPERDRTRGRDNQGRQPPQAALARQALAMNAPPRELRQAPRPAANNGAPAQQFTGPAPRMLPQDRRGRGRELREVPVQQPVAGAPQAVPRQDGGRFARPGDQRNQRGQRDPALVPGQPGVPAAAIVPAPVGAPRDHRDRDDGGRGRMRQDQVQQRMDQQAAAQQQLNRQQAEMQQRQAAAEQQRNQQQAEAQQHQRQQQGAAEQQRNQQRAEAQRQQRQQQEAAEQQRNQQQAEAQRQQRQQQDAGARQRNQQQAEGQQRQREQQEAGARQRNQQQAEGQSRQREQQEAGERQRNQQQAEGQQRQRQQEATGLQRIQQQAAEHQRNQQQAEAQQRQQQAAEQQRNQQQAAAAQQRAQQQAAEQQRAAQQRDQQQAAAAAQRAQQQQAAEQQRNQQQAAAEQRRAERQQRQEAPAPQPAPAAAPAAASAQPEQKGRKAEREERRHRDRPEQN